MSITTELAKTGQLFEYILCIEGIGWPTDESESDFASGFDGDVWVNANFNGDLASKLGCTIHLGLERPNSISDEFDPVDFEYELGGMSFDVIDTDGVMATKIRPLDPNGTAGKLSIPLKYTDTSILIASQQFSEGAVVWVSAREAVLLGTESGSGPWTYANSTRGYLGTPRGKFDNNFSSDLDEFSWATNTDVRDYNRYWRGRRVMLLVHVPGEAVTEVKRLYVGQLNGITLPEQAVRWRLKTDATVGPKVQKIHIPPDSSIVAARVNVSMQYQAYIQGRISEWGNPLREAFADYARLHISPGATGDTYYGYYSLAFAYLYRNYVTGGTPGAIAQWDNWATPQAKVGSAFSQPLLWKKAILENKTERMLTMMHRALSAIPAGSSEVQNIILIKIPEATAGKTAGSMVGILDEIDFLLTSGNLNSGYSDFLVNGEISNNPVDIMLAFLTSTNSEFFIGDATGGTTSAPTFATSAWPDDALIGYSLYCVEGTNLGEVREIIDNSTAAGTLTITLDQAFTNAVGTNEYQVRNSNYDTLPFGWGMQVPNWAIDIDSFEHVRDKYLAGTTLAKFDLGGKKPFNLWELLVEGICKPYGLLMRNNRTTGKLELKYIGNSTAQDGVDDDYVIVDDDAIVSIGPIDFISRPPLTRIQMEMGGGHVNGSGNEDELTVNIIADDLELSLPEDQRHSMDIKALFDDRGTFHDLVPQMRGRIRRNANPPPECDLELSFRFAIGSNAVQAGDVIIVSDTTAHNPWDPYNNSYGWSNMLCRVVSTSIEFERPSIQCRVQILGEVFYHCRVAPAVVVTAKGSDGGGAYLTVEATNYVIDIANTYDVGLFVAGDYVELRTQNGAVRSGAFDDGGGGTQDWDTVLSVDEANNKLYLTNGVDAATSINATDYVTFRSWISATNTSNMELYAAGADANETLDADVARQYR